MPDHSSYQRPTNSVGETQRKLSPRSHSSRVGMAWSRRTEEGYRNFKCPVCGDAVRYRQVRGNKSPLIECSNPGCRWTVDELIPEKRIIAEEQKPKAISSRQWNLFSGKAVS
jgi:predicted RNA-binding Zn-ribbon protein involved in translation (DUF1610 family)